MATTLGSKLSRARQALRGESSAKVCQGKRGRRNPTGSEELAQEYKARARATSHSVARALYWQAVSLVDLAEQMGELAERAERGALTMREDQADALRGYIRPIQQSVDSWYR